MLILQWCKCPQCGINQGIPFYSISHHVQLVCRTCTSVARVSYVSLRQCQFWRPSVSATPGRLKAQCLAISVSTVWARAGSVMERYWSSSCCGMTFCRAEAKVERVTWLEEAARQEGGGRGGKLSRKNANPPGSWAFPRAAGRERDRPSRRPLLGLSVPTPGRKQHTQTPDQDAWRRIKSTIATL